MLMEPDTTETNTVEQILPHDFVCPITRELMHDPVSTADGFHYERANILTWLHSHNTSPMTGLPLKNKALVEATVLKRSIQNWLAGGNSDAEMSTMSSVAAVEGDESTSPPLSDTQQQQQAQQQQPPQQQQTTALLSLNIRLNRAAPAVANSPWLVSTNAGTGPRTAAGDTAIPTSIVVKVSSKATIADVKRAIIRATHGRYVPDKLIIRGTIIHTQTHTCTHAYTHAHKHLYSFVQTR